MPRRSGCVVPEPARSDEYEVAEDKQQHDDGTNRHHAPAADAAAHIAAGLTLFHAAHRDFSCVIPEYMMMPFLRALVKHHTLYTGRSDTPNDLQEDHP